MYLLTHTRLDLSAVASMLGLREKFTPDAHRFMTEKVVLYVRGIRET